MPAAEKIFEHQGLKVLFLLNRQENADMSSLWKGDNQLLQHEITYASPHWGKAVFLQNMWP